MKTTIAIDGKWQTADVEIINATKTIRARAGLKMFVLSQLTNATKKMVKLVALKFKGVQGRMIDGKLEKGCFVTTEDEQGNGCLHLAYDVKIEGRKVGPGRKPGYTAKELKRVATMREQGLPAVEIARHLNRKPDEVSRMIDAHRKRESRRANSQ
ncbi:MAG: hypothetical protein EPN23_03435 [Verrucomicrobia bacterium]|nr:MAG: hypothetical protein EPN23_03435 [Verrucomicrobiota bacterium]